MDSDQWLDFTVFTGLDKYKKRISDMVKKSKRLKEGFNYMAVISTIYMNMEDLILQLEDIL